MTTTRPSRSSIKLSRKEYTKITASLRKARQDYDVQDADSDDDGDRRHSQSFFHEASFLDAPLNSRLDTSSAAHTSGVPTLELAHMPLHVQQAAILNDLLFVLFGIPGEHITLHPDYSPEDDDPLRGITYTCHRDLDPSLSDLVKRILPLATYYTALEAFIASRSHLEFGLVNHALCASLRDIIKVRWCLILFALSCHDILTQCASPKGLPNATHPARDSFPHDLSHTPEALLPYSSHPPVILAIILTHRRAQSTHPFAQLITRSL